MSPTTPPFTAFLSSERIYKLALNPWMILVCLSAGAAFGLMLPVAARSLAVIGIVYVDLLKMIVLPFMVSADIFSLQRLFKEGGAGQVHEEKKGVDRGVHGPMIAHAFAMASKGAGWRMRCRAIAAHYHRRLLFGRGPSDSPNQEPHRTLQPVSGIATKNQSPT
jgi:hypothetical protein